MGRGGKSGDFADRDKQAADTFGAAAAAAGVDRVIYLGGLEPSGDDASEHLESRARHRRRLRRHVPGLVHVRAAMVIGCGSASFVILSHLVGGCR